MQKRSVASVALMGLLLLVAAPAAFGQDGNAGQLFVTASGTSGTFSSAMPIGASVFTGVKSWKLTDTYPTGIDLMDGGTKIAHLDTLEVTWDADPAIILNFSATNLTNGPINLGFNASLAFSPVANPSAQAKATVMGLDNDANGVTIGTATGDPFSGKLYRATYNGSTVYADIVNGFTATTFGSDSYDTGWAAITGPATDMKVDFQLNVSALDQVSGLSKFEIVPEPATLGLMALGLFGLIRRRR